MIYLNGTKILDESDKQPQWNLISGTSDFSGGWFNLQNTTANQFNGNQVVAYNNQDWQGPCKTVHIEPGFYTFSLMMNVNQPLNGTISFFVQPSYSKKKQAGLSSDSEYLTKGTALIKNIPSGWNKYSVSFSVKEEGYIEPRIETSSNNNSISLAQFKLERGGTATPWMPAIADLMLKNQNGGGTTTS